MVRKQKCSSLPHRLRWSGNRKAHPYLTNSSGQETGKLIPSPTNSGGQKTGAFIPTSHKCWWSGNRKVPYLTNTVGQETGKFIPTSQTLVVRKQESSLPHKHWWSGNRKVHPYLTNSGGQETGKLIPTSQTLVVRKQHISQILQLKSAFAVKMCDIFNNASYFVKAGIYRLKTNMCTKHIYIEASDTQTTF